MKFTNKQAQYQSKISPYPTYLNSYVRDGKIQIGEDSEFLEIDYLFCHTIDELKAVDGVEQTVQKEVKINSVRSFLRFTEDHTPTTIMDGENEVEVYEYILTGGTYDKSKIANWGKPDLHRVMGMFELSSLTDASTGLVIKNLTEVSSNGNIIPISSEQSAQIKQLMIDWIGEKVFIENDKLNVNFELSL